MQPSSETIAPETAARVRQQYLDGAPVARILADNDIARATLYLWLAGGPPGPDRLPAIPLRHRRAAPRRRAGRSPRGSARGPRSQPGRKALVARLWQTAQQQVEEVEQRLARAGQEPLERERDTRTLAVLAKALRELTALDRAHHETTATNGAPQDEDDAVPTNLDELRRELARRVDRLRRERDSDGGAGRGGT